MKVRSRKKWCEINARLERLSHQRIGDKNNTAIMEINDLQEVDEHYKEIYYDYLNNVYIYHIITAHL